MNLAGNEGEKSAKFIDRMCQITLEAYWTQNVKGEEGFEGTDGMVERLGAGWTASFLVKIYTGFSLSNTRILQGYHGIIYGSGPGVVRDVWSRKFHKMTSSGAH